MTQTFLRHFYNEDIAVMFWSVILVTLPIEHAFRLGPGYGVDNKQYTNYFSEYKYIFRRFSV